MASAAGVSVVVLGGAEALQAELGVEEVEPRRRPARHLQGDVRAQVHRGGPVVAAALAGEAPVVVEARAVGPGDAEALGHAGLHGVVLDPLGGLRGRRGGW